MSQANGKQDPSPDSNAPLPVRTGGEAEPSCAQANADAGDGVDVTLVRWMLSLSPAERLATLQRNVNAVARIRAFNETR